MEINMSDSKSRRNFLITASAATALTGMNISTATAKDLKENNSLLFRTRRNVIDNLAKPDLDALRIGVGELKKISQFRPNDVPSWLSQAGIHGDCTGFTKCQHGNWYFAPWHRVYLHYFEQLIAHYSGKSDFSLPYWDWTETAKVPDSFYGSETPLDDDVTVKKFCKDAPNIGRGRSKNEFVQKIEYDTYLSRDIISSILSDPDFKSFGGDSSGKGRLEATPHNFIHRWVGGVKESNMVQAFSPLDPIFWLHHCNIDRLYSNWLSRPNNRPPTDNKEWANKSFNDFMNFKKETVGSEWTCGKTTNSKSLGYLYDTDQNLIPLQNEGMKKKKNINLLLSATSKSFTQSDNKLTYVIEQPNIKDSQKILSSAALSPQEHIVRLTIKGIKTPAQQNTSVDIYLGKYINIENPKDNPGYVGSITFFDVKNGNRHHDMNTATVLSATKAYQNLYGEIGIKKDEPIEISITTRKLFSEVTDYGSVQEIAPENVSIEILSINTN